MSYTPPSGDQLHFVFPAGTYTPPVGDALHFSFAPELVVASIDLTTADALVEIHAVATSGVVATIDLTTDGCSVELVVAHGVAGALDLGAEDALPEIDATVLRYELRGEVRDSGVLVDRRVRAYRRDTGALIGEADTVAGRFRIHTGFSVGEYYVVPIHLAAEAVDYAPPCANRVLSVLAQDAA